MTLKSKRIAALLLFSYCFVQIASAANFFDLGIHAFKTADYQQALQHFNDALDQGQDTPLLHYNLGSTYYKLGEYEKAGIHFKQAAKKPSLDAIASYNLGLISLRTNNLKAAEAFFQRSYHQSSDSQLKQLATRQLSKMTKNSSIAAGSSLNDFSTFISLTYNYDDNITNANEDLLQSPLHSDNYVDLYALLNYKMPVNNSTANSVRLGGYFARYRDFTDYDQTQINFGVYHDRPLADWQLRLGLHTYRDTLGDTDFQQRNNVQLRGDLRYLARQRLRLQYDFTDINELDDRYRPLSGYRHRLRAENNSRLNASHNLKLGYKYEYNHRNDLTETTSFTSYSPTRNAVYTSLQSQLTDKIRSEVEIEYRYSLYHDANFTQSTNLGRRNESRWQTTLQLSYRLTPNCELETTYRYTNNDSNDNAKIYQSNYFSLGLTLSYF